MSKANNLTDFLTDVANAIRTKKGTSGQINPQDFSNEIANLPAGGNDKGIIEKTLTEYIDTKNEISYIGSWAFQMFSNLSIVSFPACTIIDRNAFTRCYNLTSANFPACTSVSFSAFGDCSSLASVSFPACIHIYDYAFEYCSNLTSVNFPACVMIGENVFRNCYKLTTVSLPKCSYIGGGAFFACSSLKSVYLMSSSVATLYNSGAFYSTNISAGGIYVPKSLWASYKTAANWSYFSNYIKSI